MAVTCDPKQLPAQATCFRCNTPVTNKQVQLYLFGLLAGVPSVSLLSKGAATYRPLQNKLAIATEVYLMAIITGQSTDPKVLEALAACWSCIPVSERINVSTYLLANSASAPLNAKLLNPSIGPYGALIPLYQQVKIYALNVIAGNLPMATLMAGARCLMCLSTTRLEEIYLYLICLNISGNLIPPGSVYGPGPTPEFDLAVQTQSIYEITWGANDLSMTLCGSSFPSTGIGNKTTVMTKGCGLMQFFGTFAGTSVTIRLKPIQAPTVPNAPTGFTFTFDGTNTTATWNAPPAGVTSTELWTSTDNITFSLASSVAPATTSVVLNNQPAAGGNFLYGMVRFVQGPLNGVFTSVLSVQSWSAQAIADGNAWSAQVVANGGAAPSTNSVNASKAFAQALITAGLRTKVYHLNFLAPDSLIACRTPFYSFIGSVLWTNNGPFVAGDLTVNGLKGDGATKYLQTGVTGTGVTSDSSVALVIYNAVVGTVTAYDIGYTNDTGADGIALQTLNGANVTGWAWNLPGSSVTTARPGAGYFCLSRVAANDLRLFFANSTNAHAQIGATSAGASGARSNHELWAFTADHWSGAGNDLPKGDNRLSFWGVFSGLSASDSAALFTAIQNLRTSLGGGFA